MFLVAFNAEGLGVKFFFVAGSQITQSAAKKKFNSQLTQMPNDLKIKQ